MNYRCPKSSATMLTTLTCARRLGILSEMGTRCSLIYEMHLDACVDCAGPVSIKTGRFVRVEAKGGRKPPDVHERKMKVSKALLEYHERRRAGLEG